MIFGEISDITETHTKKKEEKKEEKSIFERKNEDKLWEEWIKFDGKTKLFCCVEPKEKREREKKTEERYFDEEKPNKMKTQI